MHKQDFGIYPCNFRIMHLQKDLHHASLHAHLFFQIHAFTSNFPIHMYKRFTPFFICTNSIYVYTILSGQTYIRGIDRKPVGDALRRTLSTIRLDQHM